MSAPVEADDSVPTIQWLRTYANARMSADSKRILLAIADELEQLRDKLSYRNRGTTHSDECWRWHPECAERVIGESRADLAAIKAASEDSTEYVLAQVNRELRAEIARLTAELAMATDAANKGDKARLYAAGMELHIEELTEQCAKLEELLTEARCPGCAATAPFSRLRKPSVTCEWCDYRAKALRSAVKNSEGWNDE